MSDRNVKDLHKPTKEQEELLAKAQWGKSAHVTLTKRCLFEYSRVHKVGAIEKFFFRVHWNSVGNDSQDASDREQNSFSRITLCKSLCSLPSGSSDSLTELLSPDFGYQQMSFKLQP